jgi:hypothetical protein
MEFGGVLEPQSCDCRNYNRDGCPFVELDTYQLDFLSHWHVDICQHFNPRGKASWQGCIAAGLGIPASWVLVRFPIGSCKKF